MWFNHKHDLHHKFFKQYQQQENICHAVCFQRENFTYNQVFKFQYYKELEFYKTAKNGDKNILNETFI